MANLSIQELEILKAKHLPKVLTASWSVAKEGADGRMYLNQWGLSVIVAFSIEQDGKRWAHFSVAHKKRLPTWDEFRDAKFMFLGDLKAIQILPATKDYVNINPNCLHLFACLDGDTLPDFTRASGSL